MSRNRGVIVGAMSIFYIAAFTALIGFVVYTVVAAPAERRLVAKNEGQSDERRVDLGNALAYEIPIRDRELRTVLLDAANQKVYRFQSHHVATELHRERYDLDSIVEYDMGTGKSRNVFDAAQLWERSWAGLLGQLADGRLVLHWWFPDLSWIEPNLQDCHAYYQTIALVDPSDGSFTYRKLDLYDSSFYDFGNKQLVDDWFIVACWRHVALEAPDGARYRLQLEKLNPTFVGYSAAPSIIPLDMGTKPLFLVIDGNYGFRIFDAESNLLHQAGCVVPRMKAVETSPSGKRVYFTDFLRSHGETVDYLSNVVYAVVYRYAEHPKLDREHGLVLLYDESPGVVVVASPCGHQYKRIIVPESLWIKERSVPDKPRPWHEYWDPTLVKRWVIDAGLTGNDGYMLLFEDGSYFVADYSDIAEQVRSGKLDPLGPLRDLMGLEEE